MTISPGLSLSDVRLPHIHDTYRSHWSQGFTCTWPLVDVKPNAAAVMVADPTLLPVTFGGAFGIVAPSKIRMFIGLTVAVTLAVVSAMLGRALA